MKLLPTRCFLDGTAWQIISDSTFMLSLMLQSQFIVSTIWSPASQLPLRAYIKKNTADKMNSVTQNSVWQPQTTTEAPPGFQDCTGSCSAPVETGGKLTCFIWHKLPFLILYKILLLFVCVTFCRWKSQLSDVPFQLRDFFCPLIQFFFRTQQYLITNSLGIIR